MFYVSYIVFFHGWHPLCFVECSNVVLDRRLKLQYLLFRVCVCVRLWVWKKRDSTDWAHLAERASKDIVITVQAEHPSAADQTVHLSL